MVNLTSFRAAGAAATRGRSGVPPEAWDEAFAATPAALITQSARWVRMLERVRGWRDASRWYQVPGGRFLVVPLVERGRGRAAVAASLPHGWGYGGILASDGRTGPDDVAHVERDLLRYRGARLLLAPSPVADPWTTAPPHGSRWSTPQLTHVRWLSCDGDALWRGYSTNVRRSVQRAGRLGVEVRRDTTGALLSTYQCLRRASVERWAQRDGRVRWLDRAHARLTEPSGALQALSAPLGDDLVTWVAYVEGQPAAAIVVVQGHDHSLYWRGAMDGDLSVRSHANALLHHRAMQEAAGRGHRLYCFGESGEGSSLAQYKAKFGAQPLRWSTYEYGTLPVGATLTATRSAYAALSRVRSGWGTTA